MTVLQVPERPSTHSCDIQQHEKGKDGHFHVLAVANNLDGVSLKYAMPWYSEAFRVGSSHLDGKSPKDR